MAPDRQSRIDEDERRLVRELYPSLRRFAAVVGPAEIEPDDLVQEALVRVLERRSLSELDAPAAYLRRSMYNLAANHRRSFMRRRRALNRLGAQQPVAPEYPSDVTDLLHLSPKARAVLYLTEVEGRPFSEVADLLGCSEPSARKTASRGRSKLRLVLSEEEERNATA